MFGELHHPRLIVRPVVLAVAGLLLGVGPGLLAGLESAPAVVDESPAITIGRQELSRYIVDKNYNQFLSQFRGQHCRDPEQSERRQWFEQFLAQAVIKARLAETGFVQQGEVQESVAQMERLILIQPDGLFHQSLYKDRSISDQELLAVHEISSRVFDAVIVRFDDLATVEAGKQSEAGWDAARLMEKARGTAGSDFQDGKIVWPYHPFQEVTGELLGAERGKILGPLRKKLGVYYLMVRGESRQAVPDYPAVSDALARQVRELDHLMVRRLHRLSVLRECRPQWETPAVNQLWQEFQAFPERSQSIPPEIVGRVSGRMLAAYEAGGRRQEITVGAYAAHFNRSLMRQLPRTCSGLVASLEDMMVEECDLLAARRAGLDQQPKFVQDRKNFALNCALQVYEERKLVPEITISPEAMRTYYEEHRAAYEEPVEAIGRLYHFDSAERAAAVLLKPGRQPGGKAVLAGLISERDILLQREGLPLLDGIPNLVLLQLADGAAFGPVPFGKGFAVFLKQATSKRAVFPLEMIGLRVRGDLIRSRLDELELKLARQWATEQPVTLRLDFFSYGIPGAGITFLSEK